MLWELTGVAFVDMMEQESGQILIDRTRSIEALDVLMFYAFHPPRLIEQLDVAYGDKDLYRLAWMRTKTDFHMISHVPGSKDCFTLQNTESIHGKLGLDYMQSPPSELCLGLTRKLCL